MKQQQIEKNKMNGTATTKKTAIEMQKSAIKAGLDGGRKYGIDQHRVAIGNLIDGYEAGDCSGESLRDALCAMANLSQLQQKLESAELIDRQSRSATKENIYKNLLA